MLPRIGSRLVRSLVQRDGAALFRNSVRTVPAAAATRRGMALMVKPSVMSQLSTQIEEYPHMDALKMWTEDGEAHLWTYKQLQRHVDAFANGMLDMQFKPQHKVVMWAKDSCESIVAQMGCLKAGVKMEVLAADATESDLSAALEGARLFIISPTVRPNQESMSLLFKLLPELQQYGNYLDQTLMSEEFPTLRWVVTMGFEKYEGMLRYEHLLLYMPEPSHVSKVTEEGALSSAGGGSFTEIALPHIDPEVKITKEFEDDD
mmetsp:Transcript_49239/g.98433  ORF Transcript_49239/g.98433 Transcript_49239/m.98433 type:complete len:261 (+) Transcript_49239:78-860(+)